MKKIILSTSALFALNAFAQFSGNTVKIGVLNDMSGPYADMSGNGSVIAAQLAIEDFKKINNKIKVELVNADHQNKPDIATNIANKWFDVEGVDAVFDLPNSAVALAVHEIAKNKNKISVVSGAATTDLTGKLCSPSGFHWSFDTYSQASAMAKALVKEGGDKWFFITADYNFGHSMEKEMREALKGTKATVVDAIKAPFPTTDFSSFLLKATSSKANVVALANAGADTINAVKQSTEFGIQKSGKKLAALVLFITDTHSLGLAKAQGLVFVDGFYWDLNNETREFAKRFEAQKKGFKPTMVQAGVYSSVLHYLKSVAKVGSDDTKKVAERMKKEPINDIFAKNGTLRKDGRMIHDMYLMQAKTPEESKGAWDYYKLLSTIPAKDAFRPLAKSECPLK